MSAVHSPEEVETRGPRRNDAAASATRPPLAPSSPGDTAPRPSRAEAAFQATLTAALGVLGFFVPLSTAGTSLAMAMLLALCCLAGPRIWRLAPWREPVLAAGLLLLAYLALRTLAGGGGRHADWVNINRYHELLLVPLLWALLCLARRPHALLWALLAGTTLLAVLHWVAPFSPQVAGWVGSRRISAGFGMTVCAYIAFEYARRGLLPRWLGFGLAALFAATVLFASEGRTGHVLLLLLAGCVAWSAAPRRWAVGAVLAMVVAGVLVALLSQSVRTRLEETRSAALALEKGNVEASSTGIRFQLWRVGATVAGEHLLVGTGWSGFGRAYGEAAARVAGPGLTGEKIWLRSDNPHNEYLMQLGAGGLPALGLFLLWLGLPMARAWRRAPVRASAAMRGKPPLPQAADAATSARWAGMLGCISLAFAVGCLFNSLLMDFTEGHLYAALLAWGLARRDGH